MTDVKAQYEKVKALLGDGRDLRLTDEDALSCQDALGLLEERRYLLDLNVDGMNWYRKTADWAGFEEWLDKEIRKAKRATRREWTIAVVSALIGAAIGRIPDIIPLLQEIFAQT